MHILKSSRGQRRVGLRALAAVLALFIAASAAQAQHDQHGGHAGHAPKKAAPKKPARKPAPRRPAAARPARPTHAQPAPRQPAPPDVQDAHDGHDMHGAPQQPAAPTVAPAASPSQVTPETPAPASAPAPHTHTPTAPAPVAPPAEVDHSMHAPAAPAQPAPVMSPASPAPQQAAPAPVDHSMHTGHGEASKDGEVKVISESEVTELLVMSGDTMGIRNGASRANFTPMGAIGSGTAWQPASSPMYMYHKLVGEWLFMFHGEAKIGVNAQGGARGVTKFESQNWFMPMAYKRVGAGTLQLRAMLSLEPLTYSGAGSPQLFQTGEVYQGRPIVDAQHPHDLFMELSAQYTVPLGERATWFTYFGFPGEPALGPVAFMHRTSAMENPTAPLTHHLQDSTHIAFGVLTTGFSYRWFKFEGSLFNGREPDDRRYGFEAHPFNSRSARLSFAPNRNWAFQVSHGFLRNPEQQHEGDVRRTTASVQYNRLFERGNLAAAFIWGRNHESHDGEVFNLNGYTFETTANFLERNYLYTRLELVDKTGLLEHDELDRLGFDHDSHPQFRVGAYTFGYVRDVWTTDKLSVGIGSDVTFYSKPAALDAIYGNNPKSYKFFIRLRPARMRMGAHGARHGGGSSGGAHDEH